MDVRLIRFDKDNRVIFGIPNINQKLEGIEVIVQTFILELYSTPKTHFANPNSGEGITELIKKMNNPSMNLKQEIATRIKNIEYRMKEDQRDINIPNSERVSYITIKSFVEKRDSLHISIEVGNFENETIEFGL